MEWNDYLLHLLENENMLDRISLSLDGGTTEIRISPIVLASVLMLDKMLEKQGNLQVFVFPERRDTLFEFSLAYLIHNIAAGKIEQNYDPFTFKPGEKLKVGNAVVEFVNLENREGKDYITLRFADDMKLSGPLQRFPVLQRTDTERRISPYKTYVKEKKKIKEQKTYDVVGDTPTAMLADYKTHMTSSVFYVSTVTTIKERVLACQLDGKKLTQLLMVSNADYEGKMHNIGPGQSAGIPAMAIASDLYAVNAALEKGAVPQAILLDVSNMNSISGQLDELDALIRKNIPIICITDTANSFDLEDLKDRHFNIWRWNEKSITNCLYEKEEGLIGTKVKNCAERTLQYLNIDGREISTSIQKISLHKKETMEGSPQIMKVYSAFYNLAFSALYTIVPIADTEKERAFLTLNTCEEILSAEEKYLSELMAADYKLVIDLLKKVFSEDLYLLKVNALKELLSACSRKDICIIIPERVDRKAVYEYWSNWSARSASHNNITVLYPGEFYSSDSFRFDRAIVVGWINRIIMRKILYSFNCGSYCALLYDHENLWQKHSTTEWKRSLQISDNNEIIRTSINSNDFHVSSVHFESEIPESEMPEIQEDEQEEIELVLRENAYRRYTSGAKGSDVIDAIPVSYVGGFLAFYRTGHKLISATPIIAGDNDAIKLVLPSELKIGDFVVVREADKDIIKELADIILNNSGKQELRSIAGKWKEVLEIEMLFSTVEDFYRKMVEAGCTKGLPTIKRWVEDEDVIAPQQKQDLLYIAEVTQSELLKEMADQIFAAAQIVKSAHTKAGRVLSQQLQKNLVRELINYGSIDPFNFWEPIEINIEDIGSVKVLKVIDVGSAVVVDVSDTNRLIDE